MFFEWDPLKEAANRRKHRISFHEAATVFGDSLSTTFRDADRAHEEHRYITIGMSQRDRILVVAHTEQGDTVRVISARRATRRERRFYEENR
ncbi:MAG: BrnT family toxin [Candidatus Methylomirabilales bacterium]